jgi:8-oxo-dGTP pyrophosphatase MutT (NUDIX family)
MMLAMTAAPPPPPPVGPDEPAPAWFALREATRARVPRVPFWLAGRRVGSVAREHLAALRQLRAPLAFEADALHLAAHPEPSAQLAPLNEALRHAGLIRAWRDETFPIFDPATLRPLAHTERAAARFWGTLTLGAHATGFVRDTAGAISHLWIATRSPHKATDPGRQDNLVGGGVGAGQTPREALVREGFEEAGLEAAQMAHAVSAGVLRLHRDIPEGFQHEWLYAFDLELPPDVRPRNRDGEVAGFSLMPVAQAAELATGAAMTVDAALVTLDFLLRRGLVAADEVACNALAALRVHPPSAGRD